MITDADSSLVIHIAERRTITIVGTSLLLADLLRFKLKL